MVAKSDKKAFGKRQTAIESTTEGAKVEGRGVIIGTGVVLSAMAMSWLLFGRPNQTASVNDAAVMPAIKPLNSCGLGVGVGASQDNWVGVKRNLKICPSPLVRGEDIVNEKSTAALGRTDYHQIIYGQTLLEKCRFGEWSQISILEPYWLRDIGGWVPTEAIRSFHTANGRRVFMASDIYWDNDLRRYDQDKVISAFNAVIQRDNSYPVFDPGTLGVSSRYGSFDDPIFFVTCQTQNRRAYNVFFDINSSTYNY